MTDLRSALHDYLTIRHQLGYELKDAGQLLENYVAFMEHVGARRITTELALAWAKLPVDAHPHRWRRRLGYVRGFARYLATIDPVTEVPSKDLLPAPRPRVSPYLYSRAEIEALMAAARELTPPLRAATYATLIGLMAVTGLRIGEALGLDRPDVDLNDGALHVRHAKQSKQREVPLHDSTTRALLEYSRLRDRRWPKPHTSAFFVSNNGGRLTACAVHGVFPKLIRRVGLEGARRADTAPPARPQTHIRRAHLAGLESRR